MVYCIFALAVGHWSAVEFTLRASCHQYHWPMERSSDPRQSCTKTLLLSWQRQSGEEKHRWSIFHIPDMIWQKMSFLSFRSASYFMCRIIAHSSTDIATGHLIWRLSLHDKHDSNHLMDWGAEQLVLVIVLVRYPGPVRLSSYCVRNKLMSTSSAAKIITNENKWQTMISFKVHRAHKLLIQNLSNEATLLLYSCQCN